MKKAFIIIVVILILWFLFIYARQMMPPSYEERNTTTNNEAIISTFDESDKIQEDDMIVTSDVTYFSWSDQNVWYMVKPKASWKYPALILIHEWWWLNDNIKSLARDFAKEGYVVLAVDLYWSKSATTPNDAMKLASGVSADEKKAFDNLKAAVAYLKWESEVDATRLWSVGWCFGWGWSYQMAKNSLWTVVSVMYYWRFNTKDDLSMMKSQILGHFWEKDASIKVDTVKEFQAKLKTLSWEHMVYIYPNAWHWFANAEGQAYDKDAADLAWQRTTDFLSKYLKNK